MGMVASEKDGDPWKMTRRAASPEAAIRDEPTQRGKKEFMRRERDIVYQTPHPMSRTECETGNMTEETPPPVEPGARLLCQ